MPCTLGVIFRIQLIDGKEKFSLSLLFSITPLHAEFGQSTFSEFIFIFLFYVHERPRSNY